MFQLNLFWLLVMYLIPMSVQFSRYKYCCVSTSLINIISINNIMAVTLWHLCCFVIITFTVLIIADVLLIIITLMWAYISLLLCIIMFMIILLLLLIIIIIIIPSTHITPIISKKYFQHKTIFSVAFGRLPTMQTSNPYLLQHPAARYWCRNRWNWEWMKVR